MIGVKVFSSELPGKLFLFFTQWFVYRCMHSPQPPPPVDRAPALLSWPLASEVRVSKIITTGLRAADSLGTSHVEYPFIGNPGEESCKKPSGPQQSGSVMFLSSLGH